MKERRVALVTGGAQGIGLAISQSFVMQGMAVAIVDSDAEAGREAEEALALYGPVLFLRGDVSTEKDAKRCVFETVRHFKQLDILVNDAGIMIGSPDGLDLRAWHRVIGTNLTSAFLFTHFAVPHLRKTKGTIVNIASTRALMSEPNTAPYSASKGGLVALTHSLAVTLGPDIRVNCISPGWIDVSEWKKKSERKKLKLRPKDHAQHPVGRVGTPPDVAALASFLVSSEASFITGQNYVTDGGMTRKMIYAD